MIRFFRASVAILSLLLVACGDKSASSSTEITNFAVTPGDSQVVITWDSHPGIYYDLYYKLGSGVSLKDFDDLKVSIASPYTLTNLTNQSQYSFILTATASGGVPGPPTAVVTATPGGSGTGISWTIGTPFTSETLRGVVFGGNTYVAVGTSAVVYSAQYNPTSTGSITSWTNAINLPISSSVTLTSVAFDGTLFVALGLNGSIITSNNTASWSSATSIVTSQELYGITFGSGTYVVVGAGGTIMTNNTPGASGAWTAQTSGTAQDLYGIKYVNGDFIAVGANGTLLTSHDGVTWTTRTSHTTNHLWQVAYGLGTYVVVGSSGTILSSADGATWIAQTPPTSQSFYTIAFGGNDQFVAAGDVGRIAFSSSGANDSWTLTTAGSSDLFGIAPGGVFVAVGVSGANVSGK